MTLKTSGLIIYIKFLTIRFCSYCAIVCEQTDIQVSGLETIVGVRIYITADASKNK